jgi:sugar lactone lactonase YvrE
MGATKLFAIDSIVRHPLTRKFNTSFRIAGDRITCQDYNNKSGLMNRRSIKPQLFLRGSYVLGEGPFWHHGQLGWIDIECGHLLLHRAGETKTFGPFGQRIGVAVPTSQNTFVLALERNIVQLNPSNGTILPLCEDIPIASGHRFNDGKCDPAGRFLVGTLEMSGFQKTDKLYIYETGKPLRILREGLSISNGMAWSEDGKIFYHIDTPTRTVSAFDYDVDQGLLSNERTILTFSKEEGWPDGMAIDRNGHLWIAFWDGWAVRCYDPSSGKCLAEIPVPCARPTSCCFGGPELKSLYITTARQNLSEKELSEQPLAGSLFVCAPMTSGFPCNEFR